MRVETMRVERVTVAATASNSVTADANANAIITRYVTVSSFGVVTGGAELSEAVPAALGEDFVMPASPRAASASPGAASVSPGAAPASALPQIHLDQKEMRENVTRRVAAALEETEKEEEEEEAREFGNNEVELGVARARVSDSEALGWVAKEVVNWVGKGSEAHAKETPPRVEGRNENEDSIPREDSVLNEAEKEKLLKATSWKEKKGKRNDNVFDSKMPENLSRNLSTPERRKYTSRDNSNHKSKNGELL